MIGTLGFYGIYWFYVTAKEMHEHLDENITPAGNWTLLAILPLLNIISMNERMPKRESNILILPLL